MLRGLFVTGTDTGVGKTTVAAALMHRFRSLHTLRYWKPIQTGIEQDDDTATVRELGGCAENEFHASGIRLLQPVAPYLAAELSGTRISIADVVRTLGNELDSFRWVVEGAGGVLVPLNESEFMLDLIVALGMPALIATRSSLGTINHSLLTIEALRRRRVEIAGVVLIGPANPGNREAIERFGNVTIVGEMPHFSSLTAETLGGWATSEFDARGLLTRHFTGPNP